LRGECEAGRLALEEFWIWLGNKGWQAVLLALSPQKYQNLRRNYSASLNISEDDAEKILKKL